MRVSTAFNTLLAIPGESVSAVRLEPAGANEAIDKKLEGLNSTIRLTNHRGHGHHAAAALIAMIYLCCGGITMTLPFT